MSKLSEKLRQLRQLRGMSRQKLAELTGLSVSTILHYEDGTREPGIDMLEIMSDIFKVDLTALADDVSKHEKHIKYFNIKAFCKRDADVIEKLQSVPDVTDYVKALIRQDISQKRNLYVIRRKNKQEYFVRIGSNGHIAFISSRPATFESKQLAQEFIDKKFPKEVRETLTIAAL